MSDGAKSRGPVAPARPGGAASASPLKIAADVEAHGSKAYRRYVIVLLMIVGTLNYMDRQIMNILAESVKQDLHLADWQLGVLTGLGFAVFYSALSVPIARLADRSHRPYIISVALAVWSLFTLLSGFANSFLHLLLARIGVGGGEAGGTPPSHSLVSDFTTPQNRASALAFVSLASPFGALLGLGMGGLIADAYGWRVAFMVAGAPGILLAIVIALTIREPRHATRALAPARDKADSAFKEIAGKKTFWWLVAGCSCTAFLVYGHGAFYGSFFLRQHGAELSSLVPGLGPLAFVGIILGVLKGVGGAAGTLAGGQITDWLVKKDLRHYCTVPAVALTLGAPSYVLVLLAPGAVEASLLLLLPAFLSAIMFGPGYATIQTLVRPGSRATAAAVFMFILNIIGLGLGPLSVGIISDLLKPALGATEGLKWAMISITPLMLIAAGCFWMARRTIVQELRLD